MRYLELRAEGWRNLAPCRLEFHPAVNFIHGANGQGKTNLIEALLYLVSGRSHRRARDEIGIAIAKDAARNASPVQRRHRLKRVPDDMLAIIGADLREPSGD